MPVICQSFGPRSFRITCLPLRFVEYGETSASTVKFRPERLTIYILAALETVLLTARGDHEYGALFPGPHGRRCSSVVACHQRPHSGCSSACPGTHCTVVTIAVADLFVGRILSR